MRFGGAGRLGARLRGARVRGASRRPYAVVRPPPPPRFTAPHGGAVHSAPAAAARRALRVSRPCASQADVHRGEAAATEPCDDADDAVIASESRRVLVRSRSRRPRRAARRPRAAGRKNGREARRVRSPQRPQRRTLCGEDADLCLLRRRHRRRPRHRWPAGGGVEVRINGTNLAVFGDGRSRAAGPVLAAAARGGGGVRDGSSLRGRSVIRRSEAVEDALALRRRSRRAAGRRRAREALGARATLDGRRAVRAQRLHRGGEKIEGVGVVAAPAALRGRRVRVPRPSATRASPTARAAGAKIASPDVAIGSDADGTFDMSKRGMTQRPRRAAASRRRPRQPAVGYAGARSAFDSSSRRWWQTTAAARTRRR